MLSNRKYMISILTLGMFLLGSMACNTLTGVLATPTVEYIPTGAADTSGFITQAPQEVTTVPTVPQLPEAPVSGTSYGGVSFSFDPVVANNVTPRTVPANTPPQDAAPWDAANPEYIQFKFSGYPLTGTDFEPILEVYPVMAYENVNAAAIEKIDSLRQFLKDKQTNPENIPFLPTINAGQMLHAGVAYLNFKNGTGVRYLTQYGQSFAPINNKSMFYTFQGITNDDMYYVSAIFPLSHPDLPADGSQVPSGDYQAFTDNFPKYILEMETTLSNANASSFTPNLARLDALIQSLEIMK
jgi:hypothetical protein